MRLDKWTYIIGAATVATATELGLLAAGKPGALGAFAGLVPAVLWQIAADRRKKTRERDELLDRAAQQLVPPELPGGAAKYLRPEDQVVKFWPRPELAVLRSWSVSTRHTDIQLITGEGGAGKTRLALQFGQEAAQKYGWQFYWVSAGEEAKAAAAVRESQIPVLLILDYAETRTDLGEFLTGVIEDGPGANVRVLLLARSAGEWWQQLITGTGAVLSETLAAVQPIPLGPLTGPSGQHEVFKQAMEAFAAELNTDCPSTALPLSIDPRAPALVVHAAALLAVLDHQSGQKISQDASGSDVIAGLLRHEARYWGQSQASYGLALGPVTSRRTVAAGTLIGADDEASAARLLEAIEELADPAIRGRAARWLHDLYPPEPESSAAREWIAPLRPDLVAENLVVTVLSDQPHLALALTGDLTERRAGRALTLLARAALSDPAASSLLNRALTAHFSRLAIPALAVAVETNPQIGEQLADILGSGQWPLSFLKQLALELPDTSIALARLATAIFQHLTDAAIGDNEERGPNLISLSNHLGQLGRREDALAAINEAVTTYRQLAAARPDAFLPDLAMALNNQSVRLSDLGRREDALAAINEAVTIRRQLAAARPDAFLPDLAGALNNQSNRLSDLGRREDALAAINEAVTIRRQLAAARPDAFLPDLAMALNNQSNRLSDLGRREDALAAINEALTIRRQLAAARPDAFLPDLAMALNNQSVFLSALDRREDALAAINEAVTIRRQLADARPDAFLPDLAMSLNNQSASLSDLGRREDALAAINEAVTIRRQLADARPDAFLPDLAGSLNNHPPGCRTWAAARTPWPPSTKPSPSAASSPPPAPTPSSPTSPGP